MITCSPGVRNSQLNDSQCSLTSSTNSSKRLQRSSSKKSERSLSRESNSGMFRNFFVKSICTEQLMRDNVLKNISEAPLKKKREPTPCRSRKLISSNSKINTFEASCVRDIEKCVEVSQLNECLNEKETCIAKLEEKTHKMDREIKCLYEENERLKKEKGSLCKQIKNLEEDVNKLTAKNQELESSLLVGEENLALAKNNLEKLRKSIQENRNFSLKQENNSLIEKNKALEQKLRENEKQLSELKQKISILEKDNEALRKSSDFEGVSMKEKYLVEEVRRLKAELSKSDQQKMGELLECLKKSEVDKELIQKEVQKLTIQLDYIKRKHVEELKLFSKSKTDELNKVKKKYKELQEQYEKKEKEWKEKFLFSKKEGQSPNPGVKKHATPHSSILLSENRCRKTSVSFSLSPE